MPVSRFSALALAPEFPMAVLARHFGISRRFAWEEPLELAGERLKRALPTAAQTSVTAIEKSSQRVFLFAFGAIVFVNCDEKSVRQLLSHLGNIHSSLKNEKPFQWHDDFTLTIDPAAQPGCDNDGMTIHAATPAATLLLATVLAKSVALERIEASLETVLDLSEKRIEALEKGKLRGADSSLARDAGAVLRLEYESVHYLGLGDKPESTWSDSTADALYTQLARQFELRERFAAVRHRVEVLKDLGNTFADLAHSHRSTQLEWVIILLIAFEIVLPMMRWLWQQLAP
jgi:uncharacterized Rmd1/YagE family protein